MNIRDLKNALKSATTEAQKSEIISDISSLTEVADNKIRTSSRDISYQMREWSIEMILKKYSDGLEEDKNELFIPDYQREYKWPDKTLSRFIESILLGFPIPYMYIADINEPDDPERDGRIEIIDGSQRIRALYYFSTNATPLTDLKEIPELEGFTFNDLNAARRRRFQRETLRLVELKGPVDEDTRRNLFERINSGSLSLAPMEVRRGSDHASSKFYTEVLIPCAKNQTFVTLAPLSAKKIANQDRMELVLRFFAYMNARETYDGEVKPFLDAYLQAQSTNVTTDEQVADLISQFDRVIDFISRNFPTGFRKSASSKTTYRARYEAIAIGVGDFILACPAENEPRSPVHEWIFSDDFQHVVGSDSANNKSQLLARIAYVKNKLLGF